MGLQGHPDPGDPNRMRSLPGWTKPNDFATSDYEPPALVPVRADKWTGKWNGPFPVLVAHTSSPAWLPMWGLRAPEGGHLVVSGDYELNQFRWTVDPQSPRSYLVPLDEVYVLVVDENYAPPKSPSMGPPTTPPARVLFPSSMHQGTLLGRRGWLKSVEGWEAVTIVSDPYFDELSLVDQIALGLSEDATTDLYVQVCLAGHEVYWSADGDEPTVTAVRAAAVWL